MKEDSPGSDHDKERETQQQPQLRTPTEHVVDPLLEQARAPKPTNQLPLDTN